MSTNERIVELLDTLLVATRNNSVQWQPTADDDAFRWSSQVANVRISRSEEFDEDLRQPYTQFKIVLLNDKGRVIEESTPSGDRRPKFEELFTLARRSAYKTDDVLGTLIGELKSKAR